ncbi:MalY/PatB family protein [Methylophaga lonarensis]|uniref:MalY/PatB family protein n=1 Tax=Methylophaga lonarensis TaxID=999151 RepID=UPI003D2BC131
MSFDFDQPIDRENTGSLKFDARRQLFGREDVIPLWVADMDFAVAEPISQALQQRAAHPVYGYTVFPDELKTVMCDWFARRHQWTIEPDSIVWCPGVVPSLHASILALTEPGDPVIVQPPVYAPFFTAVTQTQRQLMLNPLQQTASGDYQIDFDHLQQCAEAGAKCLVFCSPHNPVGRVWSQTELQQLLDWAEQYQITVISDDIHADLVYPEFKHRPLATFERPDVKLITAVSASKSFNIPGLGLSALMVDDAEQRQAINRVFDSWHVSAANPFSITAFIAAYQQGDDWLDALMDYLRQTRDWVMEFAADNCPQIQVIPAQGTYLLWLDCRQLGLKDAELKRFFVEQAGIGMNQGKMFGEVGRGFMRMNIACPRAIVEQAWQLIARAVHARHSKII